MQRILSKIIGTRNDRVIKRIVPILEQISALEPELVALSDADLQARTPAFRQRLENGEPLEHLLPEDVNSVLAEMRRLGRAGGHFVFSICTRPSRITVDGQNLHPTVRPLDWWIDRIARVGAVESAGTSGRYLTGTWHA